MRRTILMVATMALTVLVASGLALVAGVGSAGAQSSVVGLGESIQKAINAADPGDTIVVKGVHREDVSWQRRIHRAPEEQDREVYRRGERAEPIQDYLPRLYPPDVRVGRNLRRGRRREAEQDHAKSPQYLWPVTALVRPDGAKSQVSGVGEEQRYETPVQKRGETESDLE